MQKLSVVLLQVLNFFILTFLVFSPDISFSYETERVESCGIANNNAAARKAAWKNAVCPEDHIKDKDPNFLCSTLDETLDREIEGQDCTHNEDSVLILCTVRCFKDEFVGNVMRAIFPPNSPNDIGGGRRTNTPRCVNLGGILSCR